MVERKRTPAEIREEFERLQREREERRLQQRTNPKVATTASEDWESQVEVMTVSELTAYKTRWGKALLRMSCRVTAWAAAETSAQMLLWRRVREPSKTCPPVTQPAAQALRITVVLCAS